MPKSNACIPRRQLAIEEELRANKMPPYIRRADIMRITGVGSYRTVDEMLRGVPCTIIGKTRKYRLADVAAMLYRAEAPQ